MSGAHAAVAVALPTMNGLTNFGTFLAVMCSIFVTSKPAASMVLRVGRLHSQPTMNRLMPFMRSCLRASLGSSDRTCSMKRSRPPGRKYPAQLPQGAWLVVHPAEHQGRDGGVEGVVLEGKVLGRRTQDGGFRRLPRTFRSRRRSMGISGSVIVSDSTPGP